MALARLAQVLNPGPTPPAAPRASSPLYYTRDSGGLSRAEWAPPPMPTPLPASAVLTTPAWAAPSPTPRSSGAPSSTVLSRQSTLGAAIAAAWDDEVNAASSAVDSARAAADTAARRAAAAEAALAASDTAARAAMEAVDGLAAAIGQLEADAERDAAEADALRQACARDAARMHALCDDLAAALEAVRQRDGAIAAQAAQLAEMRAVWRDEAARSDAELSGLRRANARLSDALAAETAERRKSEQGAAAAADEARALARRLMTPVQARMAA